jgi:hypothetical protein
MYKVPQLVQKNTSCESGGPERSFAEMYEFRMRSLLEAGVKCLSIASSIDIIDEESSLCSRMAPLHIEITWSTLFFSKHWIPPSSPTL